MSITAVGCRVHLGKQRSDLYVSIMDGSEMVPTETKTIQTDIVVYVATCAPKRHAIVLQQYCKMHKMGFQCTSFTTPTVTATPESPESR